VSPARETNGLLVVRLGEPLGKGCVSLEKPVVGVSLVKTVAEEAVPGNSSALEEGTPWDATKYPWAISRAVIAAVAASGGMWSVA
jgi:hypothetical protein